MSHPVMPRVELGTWPTPLEPAPRLARAVGLDPDDLWIKRDDLSGLGGGGNKIRKLEWTVGAALAAGADVLVTTGAPQSNHARLTAAAAARLGLRAVLVFPGSAGGSGSGNLVLDGLFGATVVWAGEPEPGVDPEQSLAAVASATVDTLRGAGSRPALIPFGGSNATGAHGYRLAAAELEGQLADIAHVIVAPGSGGTMAGLVAGLGPDRVLGVHTGAVDDPQHVVSTILDGMPDTSVEAALLRIRDDQVGGGYPTLTDSAATALLTAARCEGIALDPIYTARALAGLTAAVADGDIRPGRRVVYLHTGGLPGLFGYPAAVSLGRSELTEFTL